MEEGSFQHLPKLLEGVLGTTNVVVGDVGLLLDSHETHGRVDLGREGDLDGILGPIHPDAHPLLDVGRGNLLPEANDEFGNLLDVDHVLVLRRAGGTTTRTAAGHGAGQTSRSSTAAGTTSASRVTAALSALGALPGDDFGAPGHLQRRLLAHHLLVADQIPLAGLAEAGVGLLDADEVLHLLLVLADLLLGRLDAGAVRAEAVGFQQGDVGLVEGRDLVVGIIFVVVGVAGLAFSAHGLFNDDLFGVALVACVKQKFW
mmetsp:Transcript_18681/g.44279  ORF Transcript_18681/g.44279 Transcript_18681/m.44279 type:complete len:259 (+) Transcript_18681:838-1614(+)